MSSTVTAESEDLLFDPMIAFEEEKKNKEPFISNYLEIAKDGKHDAEVLNFIIIMNNKKEIIFLRHYYYLNVVLLILFKIHDFDTARSQVEYPPL